MALTVAAGQIILADHHNSLVPLYVRKTADEIVNNSTTLQNDDVLVLPIEANGTYKCKLRAIVNSPTTADIKFKFTGPSGFFASFEAYEGSSPTSPATVLQGPAIETTSIAFSTINADQILIVEGTIYNGANAGNLQLQWAQNAAVVGDTTVKANSELELRKVLA